MNTIKVARKQVAGVVAAAFPEYRGRKFWVEFSPTVTLWDLNWSGGSRNVYKAVRADGAIGGGPVAAAPWAHGFEGATVPVPEDVMVVRHSTACGQDCGITITVHPANAPKWLTA